MCITVPILETEVQWIGQNQSSMSISQASIGHPFEPTEIENLTTIFSNWLD